MPLKTTSASVIALELLAALIQYLELGLLHVEQLLDEPAALLRRPPLLLQLDPEAPLQLDRGWCALHSWLRRQLSKNFFLEERLLHNFRLHNTLKAKSPLHS